jgi:hypothetical protein
MDASGRDGHRHVTVRVARDSPHGVAFSAVLLALAVDDEGGGIAELDAV